MAVLDTTAWGTAPEVTPTDTKKPAPKTGFVDGLKATWQQEGIWAGSDVKSVLEYPNDAAFDYKQYDKADWGVVAEARNKDHAEALLKQANKERKNKEIMDNQNWALGLATNVLVGATNPLNYIGVGKAATLGVAAVKGAAGAVIGTTLTEPILHSQQVTRTLEDSAYNIAGAAVAGGVLGVGAKAVGNKIARGSFTDSGGALPLTQLNEGIAQGFGADSISAARASNRTMGDARINLIPFLPPSWNEKIVRFSMFGDINKSANQRLSTSSFETVRNAHSVLLRSSLATAENQAGVANAVPIEVSVGQRTGDLFTQLTETHKEMSEAWFKKVDGGTYDRDAILTELKRLDPTLGDDYKLTETSFDKVLKAYMAEPAGFGSSMDEVVKRVELGAKQRAELDADKIDYGLYEDKSQLIDIATGARVLKPDESAPALDLEKLKTQREAIAAELATLQKGKAPKIAIDDAKSRLAATKADIDVKKAELDQYTTDFENLIPSSKTHRFAYEDGGHYLSRVFDKGRIISDRVRFQDALIDGWNARNPNVDYSDPTVLDDLRRMAELVTEKVLNENDTVSLGDLKQNLDLPGKYTKGRTLSVDDSFLLNFTSDDVLSTEMYHVSQSAVDVELAKAGVKFNDLLREINQDYAAREMDINVRFKNDKNKADKEIRKLAVERAGDIEQLEFAMRRLKRKGPPGQDSVSMFFNNVQGVGNRLAGMAQLGSSAFPNSMGDVASVARAFGTGKTLKFIAKFSSPADHADMKANAKQLGLLSDLIDTTIRETQLTEQLADSMNPNKGFAGRTAQKFDRGLDKVGDVFAKVSLIQGWAKAGRMVASSASTQHILDAATKGWDNLSSTARADFAKFYIDKDMMERIAAQAKKHGQSKNDLMFAELNKWDDAEAARIFKASVYAHTEAALNIPSIGSGSRFMSETFIGRMMNRFQSFNNAAYESTFLQSLQNREVSRVATGALNYAFWGFASVVAYDTVTGRDVSLEKYFGDTDAMTTTGWKILLKGGFVAAPSDKAASIIKTAGDDWNPLSDEFREIMPKGLEDELFPKFDDVTALEKIAGPTFGYAKKVGEKAAGLLDGDVSEKDIGGIRNALPGQNIGWLRRGIDYVEEALGGRDADRNADK